MTRLGEDRRSSKVEKQDLEDVTGGGRDPQAGHTPPGVYARVQTGFAKDADSVFGLSATDLDTSEE